MGGFNGFQKKACALVSMEHPVFLTRHYYSSESIPFLHLNGSPISYRFKSRNQLVETSVR